MVLRVRGSTGSLGKLTLQRDCGVSWRYQAIALTKGVADFGQGALKLTYNALLVDVDWGVVPKSRSRKLAAVKCRASPRFLEADFWTM